MIENLSGKTPEFDASEHEATNDGLIKGTYVKTEYGSYKFVPETDGDARRLLEAALDPNSEIDFASLVAFANRLSDTSISTASQ